MQTPRSEPLKQAGDEGGQFVFRLATTPTLTETRSDALQTERQRLEAERKKFEAEREVFRQQTEERARLDVERQQLAEEQQQFAEEQAQLMAKVPAYSTPQRLGKKISGQDGASMMLVPSGAFTMGSHDGDDDEKPVHRVELDAFYMDTYEVTTARYQNFMNAIVRARPKYWTNTIPVSQGQKSVIGVDWHDAEAYCTHYSKRLPTEAEWEKAARGTDERTYPWGDDAPTARYANLDNCCDFNEYKVLTNVGSKHAGMSPYGIHDMAGNVWEWVADWYDEDYYQRSPAKNPSGASSGQAKVLRGGSWFNRPFVLRSANRGWSSASDRNGDIGFRCAQDAP
jgi:formylglycine-generating enzyme required for sulfatase activity